MSMLNTSARTVQGSVKASLVRSASRQPLPRQSSPSTRPSFLLVLLRALGAVAA